MPDPGSADLVIVARIQNQISQELASIKQQVKSLAAGTRQFGTETTRQVQQADKAFRGLSQTLIKLGAALGGLYAFRLAFNEVIRPAIEFDQALRQIWTITDATWGEMRKLGGELRSMAREFGKTADEVAWGFYEIKSSGFEGADALKVLEASIKGAAAGLATVNEVADVTTSILNAWHLSADEAAHVNDILFKTVDLGKVKIHDLAQEFGRLAGIAAPLGVGLVELAAAVSTLTIQGVQANEAVTAIRQAVIQLAKPTKQTASVIKALGYESGAAMVEQLGFARALAEVTQYAQEHNMELTKMFTNIRAVLAVLPLATTSAATYARHQLLIANATGKVDEAFGKMAGGIQHKINLLKAAVTDFEISISENLIDPITHLIELLTALADVLGLVAQAATLGGHALSNLLVGGMLYKAISRFLPGAAGWLAPLAFSIPMLLQYKIDVEAELERPAESIWDTIRGALTTGIGPALATAALAALKGAGLAAAAGAGIVAGIGAAAFTLLIKVIFEFTTEEEVAPPGGEALNEAVNTAEEYIEVLREVEKEWQRLQQMQRREAWLGLPQAPGIGYPVPRAEDFQREFQTMAEWLSQFMGKEVADKLVQGIIAGLSEEEIQRFSIILERASFMATEYGFKRAVSATAELIKTLLPRSIEEQLPIIFALFKDAGSEFAQALLEELGIGFEQLVQWLAREQQRITMEETIQRMYAGGTFPMYAQGATLTPFTLGAEDFERMAPKFSLVAEAADELRQAWDKVIASASDADAFKEAFSEFWKLLSDANPDVKDLFNTAKEFAQEAADYPEVIQEIYDRLVDRQQLEEALAQALKAFGMNSQDAAAAAEWLADALDLASDAAKSFAERLAEIKLEGLGENVGKLFQERLGDLAAALAGEFGEGAERGTLGPVLQILEDLQSGVATVQSAVETLERIYNSTSALVDERLKAAARNVHDTLTKYTDVLGKTDEEIARDLERAAREAERAAREAERAAREAAQRAQEAFRAQFTAPIEQAVATGDWAAAAMAIKAMAQSRDALLAQAAALPTVNGRTVEQSEVLQLIIGAYRRLLSTLENQIQVMRLAGENASKLEDLKQALEDLLDPLGILKRRLRELTERAMKAPIEAGRALRELAFGTKTGMKIEADWGELEEALGKAVAAPLQAAAPQISQTIRRCTGSYCEVIESATTEAATAVANTAQKATAYVADYTSCLGYPSGGALPCAGDALYREHMRLLIEEDEEFARRFFRVSNIAQEMASAMQDGTMTQAELNKIYELAEGDLSLVADAAREVIDAFEQEIEDRELFGMETKEVVQKLELFKRAIGGTETLLQRLNAAIKDFASELQSRFRSAFIDLIKRAFTSLFESADNASRSLASLNIPTGYKLQMAAWGVAAPGQPWRERGAETGDWLKDWFDNLFQEIIGIAADVFGGFVWDEFIEPLVWDNFLARLSWESFVALLGWDLFVNPLPWGAFITQLDWQSFINPINWPQIFGQLLGSLRTWLSNWINRIFGGMASQLGGWISSLVGALGTLLTWIVNIGSGLMMLGAGLGFLTGIVAIVVGALQGLGDLVSAFLKPILAAFGKSWEKLQPLIDAVRNLFAALCPIAEAFGEIVAIGIDLMTDLFAALAPLINAVAQVVGALAQILAPIIRVVATLLGTVLRPVVTVLASAFQILAAVITPVANAFIWLYNWVLRPIINIGVMFINSLIGMYNAISNVVRGLTFGLVNLGHIEAVPMLPEIPYLQEGGRILREGFAYLHAGEEVLPARIAPYRGGDIIFNNVTFNLPGVRDPEEFEAWIRRKNLRGTGQRVGTYAVAGR